MLGLITRRRYEQELAAATAVAVGTVAIVRSWPDPGTGRHRAPRLAERIAARLHPTTPREEAK